MLILASASPWRATLLKDAGFTFKIIPTNIDEEVDNKSIKDPHILVETLAQKKAIACQSQVDSKDIILAADTIVYINGEIIGKPINRADAKSIISKLSGTTHQVWTGVCILDPKQPPILFSEKTEVTFKKLSNSEIESYLDTNDWVGKAGAYQLQLNINQYVVHINGDYNNIIGLPLEKTAKLLHKCK